MFLQPFSAYFFALYNSILYSLWTLLCLFRQTFFPFFQKGSLTLCSLCPLFKIFFQFPKMIKQFDDFCALLPKLCSFLFNSFSRTFDENLRPSIGNGHLATVVHSNSVYMNGLYNGNGTDSSRARIPAMTALLINATEVPYLRRSFCLDLAKGILVFHKA